MSSLISLVVPAFNEVLSIRRNVTVILAATDGEPEVELILVDDGSTDGTTAEIVRIAAEDPRIRSLHFTRNFGKEAAIHAGLAESKGDCAIVLDADLQHPPELIPEMIRHWRSGFAVVECVKIDRGRESWLAKSFARVFYWVLGRFAGMDLRDHSDFKLLDRAVVEFYHALPERRRFFRGLIYWAGYPTARIPFHVAERELGVTRWSRLNLLRYAIDNLTSFSSVPLHMITFLGTVTLAIGMLIGVSSLYQKLMGVALDGFTTVNLLLIIIGGSLMIALGIIGHYVGRLYDEIKGRPPYLLKAPPRDAQ
ncbi:glycosyltransferase family 2 protein [Thiorhodococcus mannitoliphagus]|uniref:Glycosyltransferase family 2 protein n=1 Tax=Thiorhodococcus mannitoliphagus TaxID=329406 RepID=A0A6P1DXV9_9GAMM|nr:glycosyltransferase family 2 protein [Thiorhodococcus mannitoliphagus]NEX21821.1 glycosyltransferase family 2 protein [Thiorhodococcus mannitoliphagus]